PSWVRKAAARAAAEIVPVGFKGRTHAIGAGGGEAEAIAHIDMYFDAAARRRLLNRSVQASQDKRGAEFLKTSMCRKGRTPVQQATRVDFLTYLVDDILAKVDRASMLTSLEVRAPWLDHKIIEFAFGSTPDRLRATETERKILPKRLARKLLPD